MKNRLRAWLRTHPLILIGLGFCLIVGFGITVAPVFAQADPPPINNIPVLSIGDSIIKGIFSILALVIIFLAGLIGNLCLFLINSIILPGQNSLIFSSQIQDVWQSMLNIANIIFFVALVAFSIMIITRSGGYNLKKALTSIVTTVAMANLSYQIVLVLLEVGDSLRNMASSILGVDAGQFSTAINNISNLWDPTLIYNLDANVLKYILVCTVTVLMALIVMFVLFRLVFILIERAIRLAILTIFGPLQIALGLIPAKEVAKLSGDWLGEVIKWVLVLPVTFLILAIGQKIAPTNSLEALREFIITSWDPASGTSSDQLTGAGDIMFAVISLGVMFAATKAPEFLGLSLSAFSKTFTDFADKTVLGTLTSNMGKGVSRRLNTFAKDAEGYLVKHAKVPLPNWKIFGKGAGKSFGYETIVNAGEKARRAEEASIKGLEKQKRDLGREAFSKDVMVRMNNMIFEPAKKEYTAREDWQTLDREETDRLMAGEFDSARMREISKLKGDIERDVTGRHKKKAYASGLAGIKLFNDIQGYQYEQRNLEVDEATKTNRDPDSFRDEIFDNARKPIDDIAAKSSGESWGASPILSGKRGADFAKQQARSFIAEIGTDPNMTEDERRAHVENFKLLLDRGGYSRDPDNRIYSDWINTLRKLNSGPANDDFVGGGGDDDAAHSRPTNPIEATNKASTAAQDEKRFKAELDVDKKQLRKEENIERSTAQIDSDLGQFIRDNLKVSTEQHQDFQQLSGESAKFLRDLYFPAQDSTDKQAMRAALEGLAPKLDDSAFAEKVAEAISALKSSGSSEDLEKNQTSLRDLLTQAGLGALDAGTLTKHFGADGSKATDLAGMAAFATAYDRNPANSQFSDASAREYLDQVQDRDTRGRMETNSQRLETAQQTKTESERATVDLAINTDRFETIFQGLAEDIRDAMTTRAATNHAAAVSLAEMIPPEKLHLSLDQVAQDPSVANEEFSQKMSHFINEVSNFAHQNHVDPTGSANLNLTVQQLQQNIGKSSINEIIAGLTAPAANAAQKLTQPPNQNGR